MSKLERMNARVAKLLSDAVQEVLDLVKETVTEYQEKTVRTQRENESLRRRLQELQDRIPIESTSALTTKEPDEKTQSPNPVQEIIVMQKYNSDLTTTERILNGDPKLDCSVKQESEEFTSLSKSPSYAEGMLVKMPADHHEALMEVTLNNEKEVTALTSHSNRDTAGSSDSLCNTSSGILFEVNVTDIKSESELTDCSTSEEPLIHEHTTLNSSDHSPAHTQGSDVGAEPRGLVLVPSNSVHRRLGKNSRAAFEGRHYRMDHLRENVHVCVVCGKTFNRVGNLRIHLRSHTGEKPYGCVQCGRRFSQAGDLKKHKRVHTGEKPYQCNQCGKSFSRGENLRRHQRIHIGETLQLQQSWVDLQQ